MLRLDVSTSIDIDRPCGEVAAYAAHPDYAPNWYVNIKTVTWETEPPLAVGSRIRFHADFLGRTLVYTYEVVAYVAGERLTMRTAEGPFPMETQYEWTELSPVSTRMVLRNRGRPAGFSSWITPLMGWMVRRQTRNDLARLKRILESVPV